MGIFEKLKLTPACGLVATLLGLTLNSTTALANQQAICYLLPVTESAAAHDHDHDEKRLEKWCYERENSVSKKVYIYNIDSEAVRPELAMLIDEKGVMTHGSLLQDRVTFHKVDTNDFNPYSVPVEEPTNLRGFNIHTLEASDQILQSAEAVKKQLIEAQNTSSMRFQPFVAVANTPWRGYWWPQKNFTILESLKKFDRYVTARGVASNAAGAESARHRYNGVAWEGHCNGWAAASVLRREPRRVKTDPQTGISFSISEQKALLSEYDYCAKATFFGRRNRGQGNPGDLPPQVFHRTILYYIGTLKKPIAMDHMMSPAVDNQVIGGYKMTTTQVGPNRKKVTMALSVHKYDKTRTENVGPAPTYTKTYSYYLTTDATGKAVSGSWITGHPDFMWVPLSSGGCSASKLNSNYVLEIMNM